MREAVSLFSGSLSSSISTEIIINHCGVDRVNLLTFRSPFFNYYEEVKDIADSLWPDSKFRSKSIKRSTENIATTGGAKLFGEDSICLRCKFVLLKTAGEFLDRVGADFIVTGETIDSTGEEWSEKLYELERKAGVEGLVFRPLSPSLDSPFIECEGLDIINSEIEPGKEGSLRNLAKRLGLDTDVEFYESTERCRLTSSRYRRRLKDLANEKNFNVNDLRLLNFERYYKIPPSTKMVLAGTPEEKRELHNYFLPKDLRFYLPNHKGPMGLVRSSWDAKTDTVLRKTVNLAARIAVAESEVDGKKNVPVSYRFEHDNETYTTEVSPLEDRLLAELSL